MKNNKGLSLVELIVASAVVVTVSIMVFTMMSSTSSYYNKANQNNKLQYRSQVLMAQMRDMLGDCDGTVYKNGNTISFADTSKNKTMCNIKFDSANKILYYGENTSYTTDASDILVSGVKSFNVEFENATSTNVTGGCVYSYSNPAFVIVTAEFVTTDGSYKLEKVFSLRNKPKLITSLGSGVTAGVCIKNTMGWS